MMMTSVMDGQSRCGLYPELAGARVLITGLSPTCGVDVARAFADHGGRLVLQTPDANSETHALLEVLARTASDISVFHESLQDGGQALCLAQTAMRKFGGFDVVIRSDA